MSDSTRPEASATDVGPIAADGEVHGGRPGVPDRQPPAADAVRTDAVPADYPAEVPAAKEAGRSLWAMAIKGTLCRTAARIGLVWVAVLIVIAVFAPFLANSRPLLVKDAGGWSSPLWQGLSAVDIALPLIFFGAIGVFVAARRKLLGARAGLGGVVAMLAIVVASAGVGYLLADPPRLVRYGEFRSYAEDATVIRTPIPFSPNDRLGDLGNARTIPPFWGAPNEAAQDKVATVPTRHLLGTTVNGEDMMSRMIHASRVALAIGFVATGISTTIGIFVGAIMGYFGGIVDLLIMRVVEIFQAVPTLIVLLIVTTFFGKDIWLMMVTIGVLSWMADARFIRAEFLKLRGQDFVQATKAAGLSIPATLFRHMLPNGISPVLVNASFGIASAILLESVLSFLGLGLEAKDPSWGALLNQARSGGSGFNWWIATFPGLAIFLTVFAYILIGESLRDALDPKLRKAE